ncbi:hypothetical protein Aph01nite_34330 [Acrocarpospora phusangensis]|uniref:Uncharacterized protein n=1 Tax=Acrocarpospora phusangensis TaxID=1070424 RepID=A0A919QCW8_9ACTN|nr:hypothetical protein [Acrocarpospora phusangensis]GIH25123.1 hypothetical protein Aph01nite_34330 [Acrocarpospora phusangensis]
MDEIVSLIVGDDPGQNFREFLNNLSEAQEMAVLAYLAANLAEVTATRLALIGAEMERAAREEAGAAR